MKICKLMLTAVMCAVMLSSCARHEHSTTRTGCPEGYELVGSVESVDNRNLPTENFEAVRMDVGQEIYVCENEEAIFVKYTNGYARFEIDEETDEIWESVVERRDSKKQE